MAKKKVIKVLENVKFKISVLLWKSVDNSCFIYKVHPIGNHEMVSHPKYRSFSVVAFQEWNPGFIVDANLSVSLRNGVENYEVTKVLFKWPEDPKSQWSFLERFSNNNNYRRIYYAIAEREVESLKILDYLTTKEIVDLSIRYKLKPADNNRLTNFVTELNKLKTSSNFISFLPEAVADILTDSELQKISELIQNNPEESAKVFLRQPFEAIKIQGIGFKTIDKIREQMFKIYPSNYSYNPENPMRVYYGGLFILETFVTKQGDTYMTLDAFTKELVSNLLINKKSVDSFIKVDRFNKENQVVGSTDIIHITDDNLVTTYDLWSAEMNNYLFLKEKYDIKPYSNLNIKLQDYMKKNSINMSDEQESIFDSVSKNKVTLVVGAGGTGKTWAISHVINFFKDELRKSIELTSPTGKAAQILSRYANKNAKTIHSAFGLGNKKTGFMAFSDILVIDEYSMVDTELQNQVFSLIKAYPTMRILLVGDEDQLPSVGPGNLLHLFIKSGLANVVTLTKVFRVNDEDGGITQLSQSFRKGKFPFKNNDGKIFSVGNDLVVQHIPDDSALLHKGLVAYKHLLDQGHTPDNIMVLTPKNKGITGQLNVNTEIQKLIREHFNKSDDELHFTTKNYGIETNFYNGDFIMFNENNEYHSDFDPSIDAVDLDPNDVVRVNNGDVGIIVDMSDKAIIVNVIGEEKPVYLTIADLTSVGLGYAYTIHKSQGSQADFGIMLLSSSDSFMLNANLMYTGVSRFKSRLYFFGNLNSVRFKARTFINKDRNTLLEKFIDNAQDQVF